MDNTTRAHNTFTEAFHRAMADFLLLCHVTCPMTRMASWEFHDQLFHHLSCYFICVGTSCNLSKYKCTLAVFRYYIIYFIYIFQVNNVIKADSCPVKEKKFCGNRYIATKTPPTVEPEPQETAPVRRSCSAMKLGEQVSERPTIDDPLSGYWMLDIAQLTRTVHLEVSVPYLPAWRLWHDQSESRTC